MKRLVDYALQIRQRKLLIRELLHSNRAELQPGLYILKQDSAFLCGTKIPLPLSGLRRRLQDTGSLNAKIKGLIAMLTPPYMSFLTHYADPGSHHGSLLYGNTRGQHKIFSNTYNLVLHHKQPDDIARLEAGHKALKSLYKLPSIIPNVFEGYFAEELIEGVTLNRLGKEGQLDAFFHIIDLTIRSQKSESNENALMDDQRANDLIASTLLLVEQSALFDALQEKRDQVQQLLTSTSPLRVAHCDLHPENIIATGSDIYVVDYEHYRMDMPFWYDVLFLAYHTFELYGNPIFLLALRDNEEKCLQLLFEAFGESHLTIDAEILWLCFLVLLLNFAPTSPRDEVWAAARIRTYEKALDMSII